MILTAAIDNGFIFITFIAILTSVISAVYYLVIVKFLYDKENVYKLHSSIHYTIPSSLAFFISVLSMLILLFIFYEVNYIIYEIFSDIIM
jgi:NADH-ubiquinone oxidoreductase chain 2